MKEFMDVFVAEKPEVTISYRSGLMVYEEGLRDGIWVALSYSGSGHLMAANPVPSPSFMDIKQFPQPQAFRLNVDGQDLCSHWSWGGIDIQKNEKSLEATVTLKHQVRGIEVHICTLLDGTAIMKRHIEVKNTAADAAALTSISPLSGGYQIMPYRRHDISASDNLYWLGYMKESIWGNEGSFVWRDLPEEVLTIAGRYRRDRYRHPMFLLENLISGETMVGQLAWSGGYAFSFDLNRESRQAAALSINLALDAPAPLRLIAAGETYQSPAVHVGVVFGGLDEAIQQMHQHIRKSVFSAPTRGISGWIESGIGPEYNMDRESTLRSLEHAHSVGSEVFFIDAGWYAPPELEDEWWLRCGDWRYDKDRYPNGLKEIRDAVKSKGMLFGMWMDAERIGPKSKTWQENEAWRALNYTGKRTESGLLNLADEKICAWMESQIRFLLDEYQLDMFRLDYNVGSQDAIAYNEKDGYLENTFARYYENVYAMYDRLRADYPDVIFETCAGGGGRTDLGMTAHFTHSWVTDWQIHPRAFSITNGMTMALPPENVDRLIGGQTAYLTADITTMIRNLMFARPTIGCFRPSLAQSNPIQLEIIRRHVTLYKEFIRPMHPVSLMYHHTPDLTQAKDGFGILEMAHEDASQGLLGVFRLRASGCDETIVYPRGVSADRTYAVTFDNSGAVAQTSGAELLRSGIRVRLGSALTSELIVYRSI
ncbi:MAG: glycoside hydrolase family 36 protein [Christensenellales bacterium]|jgi:alpha-galactosidase